MLFACVSTKSSRNSAMQRYDPSKPGHEEFEVQEDDDDDMQRFVKELFLNVWN